MKTIQVPKGYKLQLVASEPMIKEPVDCVWDGNGNMYVLEMTTYMQDADATGQAEKKSRVMKLQDLDGDGKMDKSTVFLDGLHLPRMILPLDDRVLLCETDTLDIYSYRDTTGDGKADEKVLWYKGGPRGGNMEHQASGLIWNIDNWIYTSKGGERFRMRDGKVERIFSRSSNTQWGLDHDDDGNFATGFSGLEVSFQYFQTPIAYSSSKFPGELEEGFNEVWPIDNIPDTQGGRRRLRENNTLNHVTAACGHGVYRGDLMPEFYGSYLLCEPVGRLIRRANVDTSKGYKVMKNAYPKSEFIRSTDANFRPINLRTGPDGALYIVDMYRGIIQESAWTQKGTYLRNVIDEYGLYKNVQMGRIYRLVPEDFNKKTPAPKLLDKSSTELIAYLGHKNGWHRSTARKLLVLRNEKNLIEPLKSAFSKSKDSQEKIEILWTMDGIDAVPTEVLKSQIFGSDPRVAVHALRILDPLLKKNDPAAMAIYDKLLLDVSEPQVLVQAFLSAKENAHSPAVVKYRDEMVVKHENHPVVKMHINQWKEDMRKAREWREFQQALKGKGPHFERVMQSGAKHYKSLCFACHGNDGLGTPMAGTDSTLAAPLVGSPRVTGDPKKLIKIAMHGLIGPIDGKTYPGAMESLASHDDKYIADVLTYIRNTWGNSAKLITDKEVRQIRHQYRNRKSPWTIEELEK
nr:c-type cytochrome [Rubritalea marina]